MTLCIQAIIPFYDLRTVAPAAPETKFADRKGGFPHSEICGSKGARASPHLIAACHVLHRLSTPRHPLEALSRLIVLSKTHAHEGRLTLTPCALYFCQTMMSSQARPGTDALQRCGMTLPSRCQLLQPGHALARRETVFSIAS